MSFLKDKKKLEQEELKDYEVRRDQFLKDLKEIEDKNLIVLQPVLNLRDVGIIPGIKVLDKKKSNIKVENQPTK